MSDKLEEYRVREGYYGSDPHSRYGAFFIPNGPCGRALTIIACDGQIGETDPLAGWEHVSVSTEKRIPNWTEMCFVKKLFWSPEECVVQFHPPESEYVNNHPNCLHLWRYTRGEFPLPPSILVGVKRNDGATDQKSV